MAENMAGQYDLPPGSVSGMGFDPGYLEFGEVAYGRKYGLRDPRHWLGVRDDISSWISGPW